MTEDDNTNGYYLVRWATKPHKYQEGTYYWALGELVIHVTYQYPVGTAHKW